MNYDQTVENQDGTLRGAGLISYIAAIGIGLAASVGIAARVML